MGDSDATVIAPMKSGGDQRKSKPESPACLVQYNGTGLGTRYELLSAESILGRSTDVDITIAEASVSRRHARVSASDDRVTIEDLGSANGTFVNDEVLSGVATLKDQDMLRLGTVLLKFFEKDNIEGFVHDKIYRKATVDAGTELFNKAYLVESLEKAFERARSQKTPLGLIYYDLDHFKSVNDRYGHNAGDQVLRELAMVAKGLVRSGDTLARFGGEEFVVVLPDADLATAAELAERLRRGCEAQNLKLDGPDGPVAHKQTISVGVAVYDASMTSAKELLEAADRKLYTSKNTGRNRVTS